MPDQTPPGEAARRLCRQRTDMPRRKTTPAPRLRLQIKHGTAFGPGKAALLELIAATGSISEAGKALEMSYRTAWALVARMNADFRAPLVASSKGGARGGGAWLTPLGERVLARYRAMESHALRAIAADLRAFEAMLAPSARERGVRAAADFAADGDVLA